MDNTALLLLNEEGSEIAPVAGERSEVGEMYLRGTCLTLGYDHSDAETQAAFVQNPTQNAYPETVYRTGDMAYYNEYGELVFAGRRDGQIKRMGHRIETGEIEACAQRVEGVWLAACVSDPESGALRLFYTGTAEETQVSSALAGYLSRYYLPSQVTRLEALPTTPNGKIDRRTLAKE